jgi:hypothetical protein
MQKVRASILIATIVLLPSLAAAQADCDEIIAEIEQRVATGKYPEHNVMVANSIKTSLPQMCALMDEGTRANIMEQVEELLPTKSEEERRADRRAKTAKAKAAREARKRERAAAEAAVVLSPVLTAAPTARFISGQFIQRPDAMHYLFVRDWDKYRGKLRILYLTSPNRLQAAGPNWTNDIYVAEIAADGTIEQHLITSKKEMFVYSGLALRRGHDEVLFNRRSSRFGDTGTLERWSISGGRKLSSVPAPNPAWPGGAVHDWGPFRLPTSDGNVLFAETRSGKRGEPLAIGWFEASPEGQVLGMGTLADEGHDYRATNWFATRNGGGGIVLGRSGKDRLAIDSDIATPIRHEIGGRQIQAVVANEEHLFVTSDNARTAWTSAAIARDIQWEGELAVPQDLPVNEMLSQQNEYMALTETVRNEHDANRGLVSNTNATYELAMVKPMSDGYGLLVNANANRRLVPPIHGQYVLTVNEKGIRKQAHLLAYAEQLDVKFTMLGISEQDEVYVFGLSQGRMDNTSVVRLESDGKPKAWGRIPDGQTIRMEGLVPDAKGVWVIGHAFRDDSSKYKVWIGRVEFP